jgi:transposase
MSKHALALYRTRRRWTVEEARSALAALRASGLSVNDFAIREGLDVQRLYWWRRRLANAIGDATVAPVFVELTARSPTTAPVEVVLRSGRVLRVPESIDTTTLRRLVEALEQEAPC